MGKKLHGAVLEYLHYLFFLRKERESNFGEIKDIKR